MRAEKKTAEKGEKRSEERKKDRKEEKGEERGGETREAATGTSNISRGGRRKGYEEENDSGL